MGQTIALLMLIGGVAAAGLRLAGPPGIHHVRSGPLSGGGPAWRAQTPETPHPHCTAPEYRQFDFWIGEWEVRTPDGQFAGTNSIRRELGGCVLHERWTGTKGMTGESFNIWSPARGSWHQTWVDSRGNLLLLDGRLDGTRMVMSGEAPGANGATIRHRITWEPGAGGLRQLWETSGDGGRTWTTTFDGRYTRRPQSN